MEHKRIYEPWDPEKTKKSIGRVEDIFKAYQYFIDSFLDYCTENKLLVLSSIKIEAINYLYIKSLRTFYAIYTLSKNAYASESAILLRVLMEIKVNMLYIWNSDEAIAQRFFDYGNYAKYEHFSSKNLQDYELFDSQLGNKIEKLKADHDNFIEKYNNVRKYKWAGIGIQEMIQKLPSDIREIEFEDYNSIYRTCSNYIHSNIIAMQELRSESGIFRVDTGPEELEYVDILFPTSILYMLEDILPLYQEYMGIKLDEKLQLNYDNLLKYVNVKYN